MLKNTRGVFWELQFSVVGRLMLQHGEEAPINIILENKIEASWGLTNFKLILLNSLEDQGIVMAKGTFNTRPGIFRASRWSPGFDPINHKATNNQVWMRLHNLPLEFRKEHNVLNITGEIGLPLKLDPITLSLYHGWYAGCLWTSTLQNPNQNVSSPRW